MKNMKRSAIALSVLIGLLCADTTLAGYKSSGFKSGGFKSSPRSSGSYKPNYSKPAKATQEQPNKSVTANKATPDSYSSLRRSSVYINGGSNWLPWLAFGYMLGSSGGYAQTFSAPIEVKEGGKNPDDRPCDVMPPLRCDWLEGTQHRN